MSTTTDDKVVITIPVSDDDINLDYDDRVSEGDRCMLAQAMIRRLDLTENESILVGYRDWTIRGRGGVVKGRWNPQTSKKIRDWDDGVRHGPFEVNVSFPKDWRQRLNGTGGV